MTDVVWGWDASDFDWARGPMDVGAARQAGIQFFTYKATEGTKIRHVHYGEAMRRAVAAGIEFRGAYIVVRTPGNNGHGSVQAQVSFFLAYLDQETPGWRTDPGFFLQVDLEHWSDSNGVVYDAVAPQHGVQACDLLRAQTGKWVVLYAPRWAYGDTIGGSDPLWASSYGANPAVPYRQAYPGDGAGAWAPYSGRTPVIFQFGSRLTIGSQPSCDGNAFRGTIDQLRALITGGTDMPMTQTEMDDLAEKLKNKIFGQIVDVDGTSPHGSASKNFGERVGWLSVDAETAVKRIADLATNMGALTAPAAPTQDQVNAAILKAMLDPAVQKGIGDALASHLKVS